MAGNHRLWVTTLLHVALPVVLLLGITGYLALSALERATERRMQEDVELVARALAPTVGRAVADGRPESVARRLRSIFDINRVYAAQVYGSRGEILAWAGSRPGPAEARSAPPVRTAEDGSMGAYGRLGPQRVYSYFVPLAGGDGRIAGLLQVTRRRSDIDAQLAQWRVGGGLGLGALAVLFTGLVMVGHRRGLGRPVNEVISGVVQVARGEKHRIDERGPDELVRLIRAFNGMLRSLEQSEAEVSKGRDAEAALQVRLARSQQLAALGTFAAGIAHQVGTPLAVIDGKAQRALRHVQDERVREDLESVRRQVARLEAIVRRSRLAARTRLGHRARTDLRQVVHAAVRQIGVVSETPPALELDLPFEPVWAAVDAVRLEEALLNLLQNAAMATPRGRVRIGLVADDAQAAFVVEDDGPGVPEARRDQLFEPFFSTRPHGTGLGLTVVQGIAREHGGETRVGDSTLGGARFELRVERTAGGNA